MTGKTILDLKRNMCRYPTGENEKGVHIFCAAPAEYDGCPYCAKHAAECFDRRPEERKRYDRQRTALMRAMRVRPVSPPANMLRLSHREDAFGQDS